MAVENKNFQDFQFICQEIDRFIKLINTDWKSIDHKNDAFFSLPHPKGTGILLIGRAAHHRFSKIAVRLLVSYPNIKERASEKLVVDTLKHLFCEEILKRKRDLTTSLADKIVSRAIKHIEKNKLRTITQFFPCVLPADEKTDRFQIGPVEFIRANIFLTEKEGLFEKYVDSAVKGRIEKRKGYGKPSGEKEKKDDLKFINSLAKETREYYSKYPWVATIEMANFEKTRSHEAASICVQATLNILQLFFISEADSIHMAGRLSHEQRTASMTEESGSIEISCTRDWLFSEHEGWVEKVTQGETGYWLKLAGSLIPFLSAATPVPLLYQRYINALWWYGEAMSNKLPYLKVISLSNALEALLSTSEGSGDTVSQISTRANFFLQIINPDKDWVKTTKDFYALRSDLVHGRIPAFDRRVQDQIGWGVRIAQRVLIDGLSWTQYLSYQEGCRDSLSRIHELFETELQKFSDGTLEGLKIVEPITSSMSKK